MPVKIRLQRHGSKKRPFYFIVIADARAPRDGKFIQKLGTYNPLTVPATIQLDRQKALEWLTLGLFDDATAMEKFQKWFSEHEAQMKKRQEEAMRARRGRRNIPTGNRRPERNSSEG